MPSLRKLLVANRSEIAIRVFRTAHELGIRTVAIYSHEDRYALHRFKADEAYLVGQPGEPIRAYLNIDAIIDIARQHHVDAIHPGLRLPVREPGSGPRLPGGRHPVLRSAARGAGSAWATRLPPAQLAHRGRRAGAGRQQRAAGRHQGRGQAGREARLSVLLKAAHGGGGRGMRVVNKPEDLAPSLEQAQRESQAAFGSSDVFLEKFIQRPRHIEVQLIGDKHGNLVHLVRARLFGAAAVSEGRRDCAGLEFGPELRERFAPPRSRSDAASATTTPAPWSFSSIPKPANSTSSRSTRESRSNIR